MKNKLKLNTFLSNKLSFGDYVLFQEYNQRDDKYEVSRPIMAIYLGCFVADQTLGFNYIRWNNDNHFVNVNGYSTVKEVDGIHSHIEWNDYVDILGVWQNKPNWKQILEAYRRQNTQETMLVGDID